VFAEGRPITLAGSKQRALWALLLVHANKTLVGQALELERALAPV